MSTPYTVTNEGIGGGPFLTMTITATEDKGFTQDDVEKNTAACVVSGNNEVSKGNTGNKLFGKVVWVSTDLVPDTTRPATCAVQARGVARFQIQTPVPVVNGMVEVNGAGRIIKSTAATDIPAGGQLTRGQVIAVDTVNGTADVWLG